ncbi:MAG: hypothetical protein M1838_002893 [Thelocarpon superellum]|nr:MAG: hypothetical protein M1838_002893 [Thelocarpon superellum]
MDHALALNLGRAPNIQDYDITTGRLIYPDDVDGIWGRLYSIWIDHAKLQGLIYVQLYSAQAQNNSVDIKTERARLLAISAVNLQEQLHAVCDHAHLALKLTRSTLFNPFVPFIVVFGNAIARSDYNDVALLGTFVMTLHHFYQIAKAHLAHVAPSHDTQIPHDWHQSGQQSLPDLSLSRQDWDGMLDDWELGIGAENARQMSSFFEPYMIESQNKSISE